MMIDMSMELNLMTDDIVTRLRAMMQGCENPNCEGCEVEAEAVDEIERLRAELQLAHSEIAMMATAKVKEEPF